MGGYFRLLARRLLNGLQFFTGGVRWLWFLPAAILLVPPALILPFLDSLDRDRNFTLGYICTARTAQRDASRKRNSLDGVIVVDKPEGWTSHDVVDKMRRIAQTKKVGHLGTLDPIATGVLPLVIERATRLAQFYTRSDKIYEGVVRFGWSTNTYDRAGEPTSEKVEVTARRARNWSAAREVPRRVPADAAAGFGQEGRRQARLRTGAQDRGGGTGAGEGARLRTDAARASTAPTRACARTARAAPTCGRSRTIWARRWAAARTCRNCGGLASGEFELDAGAHAGATGVAGGRRASDGRARSGRQHAAGDSRACSWTT